MVFLIDPNNVIFSGCKKKCQEYDPPSCRPRMIPLYGIDPNEG